MLDQIYIDRHTKVLDMIDANLQHHNQKAWHCGTSHCWAGFGDLVAMGEQVNTRGWRDGSALQAVDRYWFGLSEEAWRSITLVANSLETIKLLVACAIRGNGHIDLSGMDLQNAGLNAANLLGADLHGADLSYVDLNGANLSGVNLHDADLRVANLSGADLRGADLSSANLSGADLSSADLSGARLSGADLSGADLFNADLRGAGISGVNLFNANLRGADLSGASLAYAYLANADLSGANITRVDFTGTNIDTTIGLYGWG
jgi:hypothetical protein